jgi:MFS family permease
MIAPMLIAGAGVSMAMPATQTAVLNAVAPEQIGKASGVFNTGRQLGGVFGVAVLALVFSKAGSYAGPAAFADGFSAAIAVSGALSLRGQRRHWPFRAAGPPRRPRPPHRCSPRTADPRTRPRGGAHGPEHHRVMRAARRPVPFSALIFFVVR